MQMCKQFSDKDWLADFADVQRLKGELPNVIKDYQITEEKFNHKFNHMDIIFGINARTIVFDEILRTMKTHSDANH